MRRLWIGIVLLSILLITGLLPGFVLVPRQEQIARDFALAAELSRQSDPTGAANAAGQAAQLWKKQENLIAAVTDHEPVEQMQLLLLRLKQAEDPAAFADLCAQLSATAEAIADSHKLTWWNLL